MKRRRAGRVEVCAHGHPEIRRVSELCTTCIARFAGLQIEAELKAIAFALVGVHMEGLRSRSRATREAGTAATTGIRIAEAVLRKRAARWRAAALAAMDVTVRGPEKEAS